VVKALSFFKRLTGMPVEEFQAYWLARHPDVVTKLAGVRRYVQSHTRQDAYQRGEPVYDGIAEVWFQNATAMQALRGTAELAAVQADEARFIDRSTMGLIITDDYVIKDDPTPPGAAKGVGFGRRKPGMTVEAFQRHWREVHGPLGAAVPGLRRYVQSHTRLSAYNRGRDPAWDGVAIIWFDDSAALQAAMTTPEWERVSADNANFSEPGPVSFIITTEHVIVG
jgi:uncharacterized protein (TIGR02118 family)